MSLVLIADDEEAAAMVVGEVIAALGYEVVTALDGEEALFLARSRAPDLVITDHMMPRRSGVELLRALRDDPHLASVPVILTSSAQPAGAGEASLFLSKPVGIAQLEKAVLRFLGTGRREEPLRWSRPQREGPAPPIDEALSWVAHEMKSPLNTARMTAELILRRLRSAGSLTDPAPVNTLISQLDRITALINSVLDAGRLAEGKIGLRKRAGDVNVLVEDVVDQWRLAEPSFQFVLRTAPGEARAYFDAERIRQVLDNLLSNATKYGLPARKVVVEVAVTAGRIAIEVTDFGGGIPASELPHIFKRFRRAERATAKGHGLGLFIASMLAHLHGGTLTAKSQLGKGTTFTLSLPRAGD